MSRITLDNVSQKKVSKYYKKYNNREAIKILGNKYNIVGMSVFQDKDEIAIQMELQELKKEG